MKYVQSERLRKLPPYLFVRLEELTSKKKEEGVDMIDFGIGDPDLPTPEPIVEAIQEAMALNKNQKYSSSQGEKDLRVAIAEWYKRRYDVDVDPNTQVCVTLGSKEAIFNIAQAFVNPGETIIAPSPGYPVYSGASVLFNEAECASVNLRPENDWLLDVDDCPDDARMLYLNYPNNPTGATCDVDYLKKVAGWCDGTDTILSYDNAYCEMCYDGYRAPSVMQATENAIEFGSFSKTFNMTGFRLGYAVGHPDLISGLKKCKGQIDSGAPVFVQKGGIKALSMYGEDGSVPVAVQENMNVYAERRTAIVEGLRELGFDVKMPRGTFYVWFDCGMSSAKFTEKLIDCGVVFTPGSGFGKSVDNYVRVATTQPLNRIEEAFERLGKVL